MNCISARDILKKYMVFSERLDISRDRRVETRPQRKYTILRLVFQWAMTDGNMKISNVIIRKCNYVMIISDFVQVKT